MDTMTGTKIVGALCGTLLIFLLGSWAGESLYHVGGDHGDHHGDDHGEEITQAYVIDVPDTGEGGEAVEEIPFDVVYAEADAAAGERIWRQCSSCHKLDEPANGTGPHLVQIVGREQSNVADYPYSSAFAELAGVWSPEELNGFLLNPSKWVPGTKMTYRGLSDVEDRANIIAYLEAAGG